MMTGMRPFPDFPLWIDGPAAGALPAQNPPATPAAASRDAVRNGSFERTLQTANLWSGTDKDGFLAGFRGFLKILNEGGNIADTPMPVSSPRAISTGTDSRTSSRPIRSAMCASISTAEAGGSRSSPTGS